LLRPHGVRLGWWSCLRPLGDILHFCLCVSVVVYPWITWRGIRYAVRAGRDIVRVSEHPGPSVESDVAAESGAL